MRRTFSIPRTSLLAAFLCLAGAADAEVDFARQVHPVLVKKCFSCHSASTKQGGLSVATMDALIAGGKSGPAVVPGLAEQSPLYRRVSGLGAPRMPMGMPALPAAEIELIRDWIDEGARWEQPSEGPLRATAPLAPRQVDAPAGEERNPIDRFVARYRDSRGLSRLVPVSARLFVRRTYLDLWGFLPPREAVEDFIADDSADKRRRLMERLLADNGNYAEHWITYWNDLLRNDEGVVYHGGRESITDWLLDALREKQAV